MIHIITNTYSFNLFVLPTGRTMGSVMNFGYSYAGATGNMLSRTDNTRSLTETFSYDNLDRLVSSSGNTADTRTFTYANNGNITQMGGLGTLSHNDSGHPYRVTGGDVTGMESLSYSAAYTSFDRPAVLSCVDQESGEITDMAFTYDAAHERVRTVLTFDSQSKRDIEVTAVKHFYLGGRYELVETDVYDPQAKGQSSVTTRKERLYLGGDAYSAPVVVIRNNGSGNGTYYNIGRDVQGSITHIATMSGTLVAEYSYDPWGRLRNPATHALYDVLSAPDLMLGRGYTGHEYIPEAGLWNANARIYDPFLGCCLSPDPYVQAPDFTQNLNRYAYALNNPLKYSDENGEFIITTTTIIITAIVVGAVAGGYQGYRIGKAKGAEGLEMFDYVMGGAVIGTAAAALGSIVGVGAASAVAAAGYGGFMAGAMTGGFAGFASGAVNGFGMTLLGGGSLDDAFLQASFQGLTGAATGAILGGLTQGISDYRQGKDFWTGKRKQIEWGPIPENTPTVKEPEIPSAKELSPGDRLKQYNANHQSAVNSTIEDLKTAGATDIVKEVSFTPPDGSIRVRTDVVARYGDSYLILEVKTTPTAPYTHNQAVVYEMMFNQSPVVPVGKNASKLFVTGEPISNYRWFTIRFNF